MNNLEVKGMIRVMDHLASRHYDKRREISSNCSGPAADCSCDLAKDWKQLEKAVTVLLKHEVSWT